MSIPASQIVTFNPGVLDTGGNPLALNGLILTDSELVPVGTSPSFSSADAVSDYFGPASDELTLAEVYFAGYDNSTIKPTTLYFAPFAAADRAAWLQSGSFVGAVLTDIQALAGVLTITVDGVAFTSSSINLSAASSFSNAATLITNGFSGSGKPICTWNATNSTFVLTSPTAGASSTITVCTGTLSAGMKFTLTTGAVLSQGLDEDTAATALDAAVDATQNWVTFMTTFEPATVADKQEFAEWANGTNSRYCYVSWDTDAQAIVNGSTSNFGYVARSLEYDGTIVFYDSVELAAFALGYCASLDFSRANGRATFAFRKQSGFTPTVTDGQIATNLLENGYSFYGDYATDNDEFRWANNGNMPGKWLWFDTFLCQVRLNSDFQLALMSLLENVNAIPYNEGGYSLTRAAMQDPINSALNFGTIRTGVVLSEAQKAIVNTAAGRDVSSTLETQGYYLQVLDPGATVRGQRGTPVINFWYTDGGAVQQITVASIDVM
jgi:hypothetical protein